MKLGVPQVYDVWIEVEPLEDGTWQEIPGTARPIGEPLSPKIIKMRKDLNYKEPILAFVSPEGKRKYLAWVQETVIFEPI